jgi:hypothetical protein
MPNKRRPASEHDDNIFEIDKILNHDVDLDDKPNLLFQVCVSVSICIVAVLYFTYTCLLQVKWKGYNAKTWLARADLVVDAEYVLVDYERRNSIVGGVMIPKVFVYV